MNNALVLFLDLDGVLITTPAWKPDKIDSDGYSQFEQSCVDNLNQLLSVANFEICLTSSRRKMKTLEEFNNIFKHRSIDSKIESFLPMYEQIRTRKDKIESYVKSNKLENYLIIDDDKSLNTWSDEQTLVQTEQLKGFNSSKLAEAIEKIKTRA